MSADPRVPHLREVPRRRSSEPRLVFLGGGGVLGHPTDPTPALRLVRAPAAVRQVAGALAVSFVLLAFALLLVPWQQTAFGAGRVIALDPADRSQVVDAPLKGRISRWVVTEGDKVEEGDVLAVLEDNDPEYRARLSAKRSQVEAGLAAAREQVRTYQLKVSAEETARELAVAEADAKVLGEVQKRVGEQATLDAARQQHARISALAADGIESQRSLELAQAALAKASAAVEGRDQVIAGLQRAGEKVARLGDSKVASAAAEHQGAVAKEAELRQKLVSIDVDLARQDRQVVHAPRSGQVLRLHGQPGAGQVKVGDPLVTLVPDTSARAVELEIDGNDIALVSEGETVSLVFEGWPALQMSGWPELAGGTFRGEVAFVDATDDGSGRFRIVITPSSDADPWPPAERLRQGVRAKGFVMLARVPLGQELWRQINGFAPMPSRKTLDKAALPATSKKPRAAKVLK